MDFMKIIFCCMIIISALTVSERSFAGFSLSANGSRVQGETSLPSTYTDRKQNKENKKNQTIKDSALKSSVKNK